MESSGMEWEGEESGGDRIRSRRGCGIGRPMSAGEARRGEEGRSCSCCTDEEWQRSSCETTNSG